LQGLGAVRASRTFVWFVWFVVASSVAAAAAEMHSNGAGGGKWSDPGTWRGRAVPGSNNTVVVAGDDAVVVDLVDTNRVSCRELLIDPRGMLSFQRGGARTTLIVDGPIESYGAIRMDLARFDDGAAELRLVSTNAPSRAIRLRRGGSIVVNGRRDLPEGERNAWLVAAPPAGDPQGTLEVVDQTALDLRGAGVRNIQVNGYRIDNTGGTPTERFNIVGCRFTGRARVWGDYCDTVLVAGNEFVNGEGLAIYFVHSGLGEIRGNVIRGGYGGISLSSCSADAVVDNMIDGAGIFYLGPHAMLKGNRVCSSGAGFVLTRPYTGLMENGVVSNCVTGVALTDRASWQLINCRWEEIPTNGVALSIEGGDATLLNSAVATNRIKLTGQPRTNWWVRSQQYLVVQVKGKVPAGSQVRVRTAAPAKPIPPGALDPNVRNSPAPVGADGRTPLPRTLAALIVNSWSIGANGKYAPPPAYALEVLGPAPGPDQPPPVLKTVTVTPAESWHRPDPNALEPTVEVTVP